MISVLFSEGRSIPVVVCEQCGKPIRNAALGMVAYAEHEEGGQYIEFASLHKRECDEAYKGGSHRPGGWVELSHFLIRLCANAGMGPEELHKATESAGRLEQF
jgi:hypothetical protein